jgi:hypothetical protein
MKRGPYLPLERSFLGQVGCSGGKKRARKARTTPSVHACVGVCAHAHICARHRLHGGATILVPHVYKYAKVGQATEPIAG